MSKESAEFPEEIVKLARSMYYPALLEQCAYRGYTHISDAKMLKQAMRIIEDLKAKQDKQLSFRNKLAKKASTAYFKTPE